MITNLRPLLLLMAALVIAGALFRQEKEIRRLRAAIAELTSIRSKGAAGISSVANPFPADIEELRREAAEAQRLRAEIAQLRREKVEISALQASIDKLVVEVSAIRGNLNHSSGHPAIIGDFDHPASNASALVSQASALAQSSPQEAAQWVAALPAGEEQDQAALAVVDRWIGSDPVAAAAWTANFAEGPLREQAMSLIARQWGLRDWNATASWLETLPTGTSRDAAIGSFVTSADGSDIKLALEWANRTEDPESRAQRVERTARRWLNENNSAARAWIEKAQLPEGMADRLLSGK
ncbi:MAG TPA: hypothetical protein VEC99_08275 [Clostridia bacterium]|nr:hypothetical protein [Clostridia bacterium]